MSSLDYETFPKKLFILVRLSNMLNFISANMIAPLLGYNFSLMIFSFRAINDQKSPGLWLWKIVMNSSRCNLSDRDVKHCLCVP